MHRHLSTSLLLLASALLFLSGCSGSDPMVPHDPSMTSRGIGSGSSNGSRWLWGQWEIRVDLVNETIEAVPLRTSNLHFNVVPLLNEGQPNQNIGFSNIAVDPSARRVALDVSLTHPFPNLQHVPGFDVKGILFTKGEGYALAASDAIMADRTEPRLVNADGYTRYWNPDEFRNVGLFGYRDGRYGTPHATANYKINVAGYKYFADGLLANDDMNALNTNDRGIFRAGSTNRRHYEIAFGSDPGNFAIFNYAVDASWGLIPGYKPGIDPPPGPNDFPLSSNCPEPYRIRVTESFNSLSAISTGTSGQLNLNIDVYDWQAIDLISTVPMEVSVVQVEVPQFGLGAISATVVAGSGAGSHLSTYTASIIGASPNKLDYLDVIVTATSSEGDYDKAYTAFLGIEPLQAFFLYEARVTDADPYSGWVYRYTKDLGPEFPNQGTNPADIALYSKASAMRSVMVDQVNSDPDNGGDHAPDSINEWANDYDTYSLPEHYHLPLDPLADSGLWNDINGITVSDGGTRFFFTNTNARDELSDGDNDPLYSYLTWTTHEYLGNGKAQAFNLLYWSNGAPRYWATDPSNGVKLANDYIYAVFLYDATGLGEGDPGTDPQRYIIMRWQPPYGSNETDLKWQRAVNVYPNGIGTGFVDRSTPWTHRLGVDDQSALDRFYILDSNNEVEVVDCDFTMDEFLGSTPVGTVTAANLPSGATRIVDLEVVKTRDLGTTRNHVAALVETSAGLWRVWIFDYDKNQPLDSQGVTMWLSEEFDGTPLSLDALDDPIEVHVLSKRGGFTNVSVFRDY